MNLEQIDNIIQEHVDMITFNSKSLVNAKEISSKFLIAQSLLSAFLKDFEDDRAKIKTMCDVQYAVCSKTAEGKNVTEKKINIAADPNYTHYRESLEKVEAVRDYIKTHIKVFENAHLMYRQYGRE